MSEVICWILGAPGETFHQHIGDLGGLRGAPRGSRRPFWLRLGVKNRDEQLNRLDTGIYALACMGAWFFNVFVMVLCWFLMDLGWF